MCSSRSRGACDAHADVVVVLVAHTVVHVHTRVRVASPQPRTFGRRSISACMRSSRRASIAVQTSASMLMVMLMLMLMLVLLLLRRSGLRHECRERVRRYDEAHHPPRESRTICADHTIGGQSVLKRPRECAGMHVVNM